MSGAVHWMPFELTADEYPHVIAELQLAMPGLLVVEPTPQIQTFEHWQEWRLVQRAGEQGNALSALLTKRAELAARLEALQRREETGNDITEVQMELIEIDGAVSDLLIHVNKTRKAM